MPRTRRTPPSRALGPGRAARDARRGHGLPGTARPGSAAHPCLAVPHVVPPGSAAPRLLGHGPGPRIQKFLPSRGVSWPLRGGGLAGDFLNLLILRDKIIRERFLKALARSVLDRSHPSSERNFKQIGSRVAPGSRFALVRLGPAAQTDRGMPEDARRTRRRPPSRGPARQRSGGAAGRCLFDIQHGEPGTPRAHKDPPLKETWGFLQASRAAPGRPDRFSGWWWRW